MPDYIFAQQTIDPIARPSTWDTVFSYKMSTRVADKLALKGNPKPKLDASQLRLTNKAWNQVGAAWNKRRLSIKSGFKTEFTFRISDPGKAFGLNPPYSIGADGFAFVIQDADTTWYGANGGGIGYHGIPRSLAIEFDTWDNNMYGNNGDPQHDHISVHTNGTKSNSSDEKFSIGRIELPTRLNDGGVHFVRITYIENSLKIFLDDMLRPKLSVQVKICETIGSMDGSAWCGFTAATGMAFQNHDILSWSFLTPIKTLNLTLGRECNVPWFITGYWKPNTKENFDEFYYRKKHGYFTSIRYVSDSDKFYDSTRYAWARDTIERILERELYQPILQFFVAQMKNDVLDNMSTLHIRVDGYTDSNPITVEDNYPDEDVFPKIGEGQPALKDYPLRIMSENPTESQYGNIRLSTIRAYWTLKTITKHLREHSNDFRKLDDANRVMYDFQGKGIDKTARQDNGFNRRVDIQVWIGK